MSNLAAVEQDIGRRVPPSCARPYALGNDHDSVPNAWPLTRADKLVLKGGRERALAMRLQRPNGADVQGSGRRVLRDVERVDREARGNIPDHIPVVLTAAVLFPIRLTLSVNNN